MIPQIKIKSDKTLDIHNKNLLKKDEDIFDKNKFGFTKINSKINNNLFNIILVDKKSENKKYNKKPSFLSISTAGINQETFGYKETKSENIDESCEKLQNRMNSLFFNKNILRKINRDNNNNCLNNKSLILKTTNKSINNINQIYEMNNGKKDNNSNSFNKQKKSINFENDNNLSLTHIPNGNEDIKININEENQKDSISDDSLKDNLRINNVVNPKKDINGDKNNHKENGEILKYKLKVSRSFNSFPNNFERDNNSEFQLKKEPKRKKSIISLDVQNNNLENIFGSLNDVFESMDSEKNKEYNFGKKEIKRYKNIEEIKEDKNYFRFLYLSSNLIEIIKKKKKYQLKSEENKKKNSISDISNHNYFIYTNDRNVLKLTALYFQKVKKAIFLFNTGKFENSYNSLLEDKIIKNKSNFALFLLIVQGIDKDKLYLFLSKDIGINNNFCLSKLYLSFFNFSNQTVIISFNFLLEALNIPSKNNDAIISLFTEAYLRDNTKLNSEIGKADIKKVCGLVLKLNNIMNDPDEDKQKNKEEFINSNINDQTDWNPNLNTLISKDPSKTSGFLNYSHVCGFVFDEYIKNENSITQQKYKRTYKELLNKKLLANNKSFSFQKSLITNDKNILTSESKLVKIPEIRRKNISIIANNKVIFRASNLRKKYELIQNKLNTSKEDKEIEKNFKLIINKMKKGEKFKKITNINGKTIKTMLILTPDENNIIFKNELCCTRKQILSVNEISDCNIGYFQYLKTNKNFENYMTIILNSEEFYEFYHSNKEVIHNWISALETLIQKRNKILAAIYKKEKISEEEISNIWQNEFLTNWSFYRKYVIKKKNKISDNEFIYKPNDDKRKTKLFKIWSLGLPFWLRESMWKIIVGNELNISLILFQGYFNLSNDEYENFQIHKNNMINGCSDIIEEEYNEIEQIFKDCDKIIQRFKKRIDSEIDFSHFQKEIYKIVRSFCLYRPDILYSKIISEFAVLFYYICSKNEFDTFIILSNFIINNYLFRHIQNDTMFLKNQLKFFEFLVEKYLPLIHMHFKELQFNANIFFYKWIEFLFLKTFNHKLCLRILDNFLIKGHISIFEVSIATLNILKKEILNSDEDGLVILLKKNLININEEALFKYIDSLDIIKEYNDYFNADLFGKEKLDLFQDL